MYLPPLPIEYFSAWFLMENLRNTLYPGIGHIEGVLMINDLELKREFEKEEDQ